MLIIMRFVSYIDFTNERNLMSVFYRGKTLKLDRNRAFKGTRREGTEFLMLWILEPLVFGNYRIARSMYFVSFLGQIALLYILHGKVFRTKGWFPRLKTGPAVGIVDRLHLGIAV